MRSKQQKDYLSLFQHWTDELKFDCILTTDSKIPSVHLDREVAKNPAFKPNANLALLGELNEKYQYRLSGSIEEIQRQLEALNHNLEISIK